MSTPATTMTPDGDAASAWQLFVDSERCIEMEIPITWFSQSSQDYLLDLHAPDDPWTAILLSFHSLDLLRFHERVHELVSKDQKHWTLQRKASLLRNGQEATEVDFVLSANGSSWLMRKIYLKHGNGLFALAFMTRHATWSRYGAIYRRVLRSLSSCSGESRFRARGVARPDARLSDRGEAHLLLL